MARKWYSSPNAIEDLREGNGNGMDFRAALESEISDRLLIYGRCYMTRFLHPHRIYHRCPRGYASSDAAG